MVSTGLLMPIDCGTCSFPIISMLGSALCLTLITLLTIFLYRKKATERICQVICEV